MNRSGFGTGQLTFAGAVGVVDTDDGFLRRTGDSSWELWESRRLTMVVGVLWGALTLTKTGEKSWKALEV